MARGLTARGLLREVPKPAAAVSKFTRDQQEMDWPVFRAWERGIKASSSIPRPRQRAFTIFTIGIQRDCSFPSATTEDVIESAGSSPNPGSDGSASGNVGVSCRANAGTYSSPNRCSRKGSATAGSKSQQQQAENSGLCMLFKACSHWPPPGKTTSQLAFQQIKCNILGTLDLFCLKNPTLFQRYSLSNADGL